MDFIHVGYFIMKFLLLGAVAHCLYFTQRNILLEGVEDDLV